MMKDFSIFYWSNTNSMHLKKQWGHEEKGRHVDSDYKQMAFINRRFIMGMSACVRGGRGGAP